MILRYAGFTILTDPNFLHRGDHVHLGHGMTATRRTDPALELEALPPFNNRQPFEALTISEPELNHV